MAGTLLFYRQALCSLTDRPTLTGQLNTCMHGFLLYYNSNVKIFDQPQGTNGLLLFMKKN
jgi:hypothetical protein